MALVSLLTYIALKRRVLLQRRIPILSERRLKMLVSGSVLYDADVVLHVRLRELAVNL